MVAGATSKEMKMKLDKEQVKEALAKDYSVTLNGGMLGYILQLLAEEQKTLNEALESDEGGMGIAMLVAANAAVGDTVLHAIYKACGPSILAIAMNSDEESIDRLMNAKGGEEIREAAKAVKENMRRIGDDPPLDKSKLN